jgi:hypothetical protein
MGRLFEKLVDLFRPVDVHRVLAECRDGLRAEGFPAEADDVDALLRVGGDHYEAENAIGAGVARTIRAVGERVSPALRRKLEQLAGVLPSSDGTPLSRETRLAGFRDELHRLDRRLRDAGFAEASAATYNAASRFDPLDGFSMAVLSDVVRALDVVLASPSLSEDLRSEVERVRRWAGDPKRYIDR